jgi:endonuclease/exonuclease/phosphatase (EEP) superfamily protein YafD
MPKWKNWRMWVAWSTAVGLALLLWLQNIWLGDRIQALVSLAVFTPVVYLPAWAVVYVAIAKKERVLGLIAGAVVIGHLIAVWPVLPVHDHPSAPDGPSLRVATVNLLADNRDKRAAVRRVVEQEDVDVVVLSEYTNEYQRIFQSEGADAKYPYRVESPVPTGAGGIALFSRYPLLDPQRLVLGHRAIQAVVNVWGIQVTVLGIHAQKPSEDEVDAWKDAMSAIGRQALSRPGPVIVAGNFNASPYNHAFREMVDGPLNDSAEDLGEAWRLPTWDDNGPFGPMVMFDHVLTSPGAVATGLRTLSIPGSDHRMLQATLRLDQP